MKMTIAKLPGKIHRNKEIKVGITIKALAKSMNWDLTGTYIKIDNRVVEPHYRIQRNDEELVILKRIV